MRLEGSSMRKVLILGVASVQADALKVLKGLGYETFACAMAKDGPGAEVADHFEIINILDSEKVIHYIKENNIEAVYSVGSDIAMPVACRISEELGLPHFVSSKVATICNNKEMMRRALGNECAGNVPFQVVESKNDVPNIEMPYIMKPADSQGQRGIFLVNSVQDFEENFDAAKSYSRSGKVIVGKYVDGPELSVNVYLEEGKLRFMVASDRETWPEYTGLIHKHLVPTTIMDSESLKLLEDVIVDACQRLEIINGPAYFQIKLEKGRPYIIEMTPRLDGCHMWKLLRYHTGLNLLRLTFEHLLEQKTSELDKQVVGMLDYELEFFCQPPGTKMNQKNFDVPTNALEHFFYYASGDTIRPVNGKFEKVGYFIAPTGRVAP